ncbi:hypothetical protein BH10PSE14_BH10PSE14_27550 [soil metagenome]
MSSAGSSERLLLAADMSDQDLVAAYQRTSGEQADTQAEALVSEIERRDLDL